MHLKKSPPPKSMLKKVGPHHDNRSRNFCPPLPAINNERLTYLVIWYQIMRTCCTLASQQIHFIWMKMRTNLKKIKS